MTARRIRRARVLGACFTAGLYAATGDGNGMLGAVLAALDWLEPTPCWRGRFGADVPS